MEVYWERNFWYRGGDEMPGPAGIPVKTDTEFWYGGFWWCIGGVYRFPQGIAMDICRRIPSEQLQEFFETWGGWMNREEEMTREQRLAAERENPLMFETDIRARMEEYRFQGSSMSSLCLLPDWMREGREADGCAVEAYRVAKCSAVPEKAGGKAEDRARETAEKAAEGPGTGATAIAAECGVEDESVGRELSGAEAAPVGVALFGVEVAPVGRWLHGVEAAPVGRTLCSAESASAEPELRGTEAVSVGRELCGAEAVSVGVALHGTEAKRKKKPEEQLAEAYGLDRTQGWQVCRYFFRFEREAAKGRPVYLSADMPDLELTLSASEKEFPCEGTYTTEAGGGKAVWSVCHPLTKQPVSIEIASCRDYRIDLPKESFQKPHASFLSEVLSDARLPEYACVLEYRVVSGLQPGERLVIRDCSAGDGNLAVNQDGSGRKHGKKGRHTGKAAISLIGGASGPTSVFLAGKFELPEMGKPEYGCAYSSLYFEPVQQVQWRAELHAVPCKAGTFLVRCQRTCQ